MRLWTTGNFADAQPVRSGHYCVVGIDAGCFQAVPELPPAWLLLMGALLLVIRRVEKAKKTMKTIIVAAFLLLATPAHSTTQHFNIFFEQRFRSVGWRYFLAPTPLLTVS